MTTISERVAASADDAHDTETGEFPGYSHTSTLFVGLNGGGARTTRVGMRWVIDIPASATIDSAYLTLTEVAFDGGDTLLRIHCERAQSPVTFSSANDPYSRTLTTAFVDWTAPEVTPGSTIQSPDFAAVLQEVIDNHGPIDALVVVILDNGSTDFNDYESFDSEPTAAPLLDIEYTAAVGGSKTAQRISAGIL